MTCDKAGTIEDVLKRSSRFKDLAEKNQNKELVIIRDGKAISSHFPCSLIKEEELTLKYIEKSQNPGKPKPPKNGDLMFHVAVRGGKNIVKIMRNPELKTVIQNVTVYACKGEKVKHALKRDGRFLDVVFEKTCLLSYTRTEATTEFSNLVDNLEDKEFQIILLSESSPPDSQPSSLDDAYLMPDESQISDSAGRQDPSQVTSATESGNNNNIPKKKRKQNSNIAPEKFHEIPDSKELFEKLSSSFKISLNKLKSRKVSKMSQIQDVFREEYGRNDQTCREVRTMKKLMELSNFVCHVRINQKSAGSGFLLFDKFVLTNGHVIKNVIQKEEQLSEKVTVHFSYESLGEMDSGVEVEDVVGFEHCPDESGHIYDWALLRLSTDPSLPNGLLTHFGFFPQSGGICIIGHPDDKVKMIDTCVIVPKENCNQVAESHRQKNPQGVLIDPRHYDVNDEHIQLVTPRFFDDCEKDVQQQKHTVNYETCFYFGSSGSPVFDEHCNVVALHSGGFFYMNQRGEQQSMIEYGYRLSDIIERILYQLLMKKKLDVLQKYLSCSYRLHENLMESLKKLVESRNPTMVQNAMEHPEVARDESLRKFFEFLCHKNPSVPMEY